MTAAQVAAVQHIHIFAKRARLTAKDAGQYISHSAFAELGHMREISGRRVGEGKDANQSVAPHPKTMTITVRECDWTFRQKTLFTLDNMMRNEHWENVLGGLKELRMELEVLYVDKEVLVPIIDKLKVFRFDIGGGEVLVAEKTVDEHRWVGPIKRRPHIAVKAKWEQTEFFVARIVWKVRSVWG